ncbi:endonuclease domain-containing protein [Methylobacterium mesophilicum]|uniref:endonuclease domain-containing protein n=1 Tax=Methylobacterium mesophilicum TaxID=39956 RepID=UPI002F33FA0B
MPWNQQPRRAASPRAAANAKTLRHSLTEAEKRLWWHLRHRLPVDGSHFRRQVALGPYVADFCCLSARLIVEVDGEQHGFEAGSAYDTRRDAYLQSEGFRVLRFPNRMVLREIDTVLDTIHAALAATDTPLPDSAGLAEPPPPHAPSPQGAGAFAER